MLQRRSQKRPRGNVQEITLAGFGCHHTVESVFVNAGDVHQRRLAALSLGGLEYSDENRLAGEDLMRDRVYQVAVVNQHHAAALTPNRGGLQRRPTRRLAADIFLDGVGGDDACLARLFLGCLVKDAAELLQRMARLSPVAGQSVSDFSALRSCA